MYLCIDSTSTVSGVTLVDETKIHEHSSFDAQQASERLVEKIDEQLKTANAQLTDLKAVFVIQGPGSFTGLRVGIAVANQFAHQLKIPIVGLNAEEWWKHRTEEKDFLYLQTMNRSEIYTIGFGEKAADFNGLSAVDSLPALPIKWLGQLTKAHLEAIPSDFEELTELLSVEETWLRAVQNNKPEAQKDYDLVEPFYGKEVNITKSTRKLGL